MEKVTARFAEKLQYAEMPVSVWIGLFHLNSVYPYGRFDLNLLQRECKLHVELPNWIAPFEIYTLCVGD